MNSSEPRRIENDSRHPIDFLEPHPTGNESSCRTCEVLSRTFVWIADGSTLEQIGLRATVVLYCVRPDLIGGRSLEEIGLRAGCTRQVVSISWQIFATPRLRMNTTIGSIKTEGEIARRINRWHGQVEHRRAVCSEAGYGGLYAVWQAGQLLLAQKRKVARSHWRLWLERHFNGTARTAQRYMALAKTVPNAAQLRGFSLQQAYLRLGIPVVGLAQAAASRYSFLPMHAVLANRFERWLRQKGDTATLPDQEKQTLRRDLRPLYEWLVSLFNDAGSTARIGRRSG